MKRQTFNLVELLAVVAIALVFCGVIVGAVTSAVRGIIPNEWNEVQVVDKTWAPAHTVFIDGGSLTKPNTWQVHIRKYPIDEEDKRVKIIQVPEWLYNETVVHETYRVQVFKNVAG